MRRWQDLSDAEKLAHRLLAGLADFDNVSDDEAVDFRTLRRIIRDALATLDDDPRDDGR